jgi:4-carboxymuconolactone decarboxylase
MSRIVAIALALTVFAPATTFGGPPTKQRTTASNPEAALPADVYPDSGNRLPMIKRDELDEAVKKVGADAIRLHGSGGNVRWASALGRQLTELAILATARAHDQPYEWSLHEMEALAVGVDPTVIDVVRHRKPPAGLGDKETFIIQASREIFELHRLSSDRYGKGLTLFGQSSLVDVMNLMAGYAGTAARLTAFNQQMPPGWKQFLPLPFTPATDILPDSRSRLPLIRSQGQSPQAVPSLYSRTLAPEGTGPGHIARHGAGSKSLEASVGLRLMALAILVTAREHDAQYQWTLNEPTAIKAGLEPAIVDIVRFGRPVAELSERDAVVIEFGRELFRNHNVSPETYARALKAFGERDLVDLVSLMAQHSSDAALLAAFDQHLPLGERPLLPIP